MLKQKNAEFDFQWQNLESPATQYNGDRVRELLNLTGLPESFFKDKRCLDAGCGNGRYTYALIHLGANVDSFDISPEAIEKCRKINSAAYLRNIYDLIPNPVYDFVFCWGVLHHLPEPREGFNKVALQVKQGGTLHIMVYHRDTQAIYADGRRAWQFLGGDEKLNLCKRMIKRYGGNLHGWWDAFNPQYNWSYQPEEIETWFKEEGFKDITLTQKYSLNMRGVKQ